MVQLKLGLIADCQYAIGVDVYLDRHPALSLKKLQEAVEQFRADPEIVAVLSLGDLIDEGSRHFAAPLETLGALEVPVYHALGNHDFDVANHEKRAVPEMLGLHERFYSVALPVEGWRLVVLDGTEISTFAHPRESAAWAKSVEVWERMDPRPEKWNGGIGTTQLGWLDDTLALAREAGERVVVACHYPILPEGNRFLLWDASGLRRLLAKYKDTVGAYFCGHHHAGGTAFVGGVPHINLVGMVDTKDNAFAAAEFSDSTLRVAGFGRQPDIEISRGG